MITLGPFITPSKHPDTPDLGFVHTGYSMELVTDGEVFQLPIYREASRSNGEYATFDDFYFPEPVNGWPVEFIFRWTQDKPTPYGRFVAVSPLLIEIFKQLLPGVPMEDILREFRSAIRVPCNGTCEWREITGPKITLTDRLAESGFVLSSAYCFGVTLSANIAWSFQDDYSGWQNITAGFLEFRPRCGKLNDGKWIGQRWHENIENHFFERFAAIAPQAPIDCFRGPEDIENLLKHFEWATTTRHSEPELRQMRIEAIQKAPELWAKPKELAELLKRKDLYSHSTSSSQIVKFLPALIEKAGNLKIQ